MSSKQDVKIPAGYRRLRYDEPIQDGDKRVYINGDVVPFPLPITQLRPMDFEGVCIRKIEAPAALGSQHPVLPAGHRVLGPEEILKEGDVFVAGRRVEPAMPTVLGMVAGPSYSHSCFARLDERAFEKVHAKSGQELPEGCRWLLEGETTQASDRSTHLGTPLCPANVGLMINPPGKNAMPEGWYVRPLPVPVTAAPAPEPAPAVEPQKPKAPEPVAPAGWRILADDEVLRPDDRWSYSDLKVSHATKSAGQTVGDLKKWGNTYIRKIETTTSSAFEGPRFVHEQELKDANSRIAELENKLAEAKADCFAVRAELGGTKREAEQLKNEVAQLKGQVSAEQFSKNVARVVRDAHKKDAEELKKDKEALKAALEHLQQCHSTQMETLGQLQVENERLNQSLATERIQNFNLRSNVRSLQIQLAGLPKLLPYNFSSCP